METLGLRIGKLSAETAIEVQRAGQRVDDTGAGEGGEERAGRPFAHGMGNVRGAKVAVSMSVFSRRWKYSFKTRTAEWTVSRLDGDGCGGNGDTGES